MRPHVGEAQRRGVDDDDHPSARVPLQCSLATGGRAGSRESATRRDLAGQSEGVDLMILGYGPHRAVLLGSVSGHVVRKAACRVIVVPLGIEAPLEDLLRAAHGTPA